MSGAGGSAVDWVEVFSPYSLPHLGAVVAFVGLTAIACVLGRRWRGTERGTALRWFIAGTALMMQLLMVAYYLTPAAFNPQESWPLHLCDLGAFLAPAALVARSRWMMTLVVFWGIGLSSQAFVQPTLVEGYGSLAFWFYWLQHGFVVGIGIFAVATGYRPGWRDWFFVGAVNLGLVLAITPVNIWLDSNYMFIGENNSVAVIDAFGPWPLRIVTIYLACQIVMGVMVLLFRAGERMLSKPAAARSAGASV